MYPLLKAVVTRIAAIRQRSFCFILGAGEVHSVKVGGESGSRTLNGHCRHGFRDRLTLSTVGLSVWRRGHDLNVHEFYLNGLATRRFNQFSHLSMISRGYVSD